jgi:RES domain-containing protein
VTVCFRLSSAKYPANSGAALYGGRWNPEGLEAVYAAATLSLAALEVLVHFSVLPRDFVLTEIRIPSGVDIHRILTEDLPPGWNAISPSPATPEVGRRWIEECGSAVLCVPSTIVPTELLYVFNPKHSQFRLMKFSSSVPFRFDSRLK